MPVAAAAQNHHRGPVMLTVNCRIAEENCGTFQTAIRAVGRIRQRNGSLSWGLVQDTENPQCWSEFFFDESWLEHLGHHNRVTRAEQRI